MLDSIARTLSFRQVARQVGVGRALLWLRRWRDMTPAQWVDFYWKRAAYLKRIADAPPLNVHEGDVEIHMLLNHARAFEGMWAVYSLLFFSGQAATVFIHDDGTMDSGDIVVWQRLFPGVQFIPRRDSDLRVSSWLRAQGLTYCETMRAGWTPALKFFDTSLYGTEESFVLLDSDVLFYKPARELLEPAPGTNSTAQNWYSLDNGYRYALSPETMAKVLGGNCIERVNSGIMRVQRSVRSVEQAEQDLAEPGFWKNPTTPRVFSEQSLWAMALTRAGAHPLPAAYGICSYAGQPGVTAGHYCGGGYWASLYYVQGLPYLHAKIFESQ